MFSEDGNDWLDQAAQLGAARARRARPFGPGAPARERPKSLYGRVREFVTPKPSIDQVWSRVAQLQGAEFETKTGKHFTFQVSGDTLRPDRAAQNISKSDFAKVLELAPLDGPGEISDLVRGSAYVWAVLHDQRVRGSDW